MMKDLLETFFGSDVEVGRKNSCMFEIGNAFATFGFEFIYGFYLMEKYSGDMEKYI